MRANLCMLLIMSMLVGASACRDQGRESITQEELVRRTQVLVDAVASGDQTPWKSYFAEDAMFFDERGENMNKEQLVSSITPLPQGYSGNIKVVDAKSHIEGDVAILIYDLDETEYVYGQTEKARYHETDTWMRRNGSWQIVAGQVLRYYADPAPGEVDARSYKDYAGRYEAAPGKMVETTQDGDHLFYQRFADSKPRAPKAELIVEGGPIFFRKGVEGRILFRRAKNGKVDALIDRRNNEDVVWKKIK